MVVLPKSTSVSHALPDQVPRLTNPPSKGSFAPLLPPRNVKGQIQVQQEENNLESGVAVSKKREGTRSSYRS